jgi:hypothetical protein
MLKKKHASWSNMVLTSTVGLEIWMESQSNILPSVLKKKMVAYFTKS